MNNNLVSIIRQIVNQQGEAVLENPAILKGFVHNNAQNVPAELRLAFGRCIEQGYYRVLRQTGSPVERQKIKPKIARQMHNICKIDLSLCAEAVDILEAVIYGAVSHGVPMHRTPPSGSSLTPPPLAPPPSPLQGTSSLPGAGKGPFHSPPGAHRPSKRIWKIAAAACAAAALLMAGLIAVLNSGVSAFEPIVEFSGEAYPSKIIATAAVDSVLGGGSRMVENDGYIGDALGDFGVKLRGALAEKTVRIEIEGGYLIKKSALETRITTTKSVEIFPRINYNYADLEKLNAPHIENVTFRLFVNDKLKKEKTLAVPFHGMDDEPTWDASRNGNKTLNNYHFVVVIRETERIERELQNIQREAERRTAEAEHQRAEAERRATEAERQRAEAERRTAEAERVRPSPVPVRDPYNDRRVRDTIAKVHANIYDVNGDGQKNCVDYSNLFYYYSPFKYNEVIINYNPRGPNGGFNHMFNAVKIDGQVVYIEPQARTDRSYDLEKFWGARYNPVYNQNNTRWLVLPRGQSGMEE